jgi:hypothetical protein
MTSADSHKYVFQKNCLTPEDYEFGSPLMDIQISPILCLSSDALGTICQYLGNGKTDDIVCMSITSFK